MLFEKYNTHTHLMNKTLITLFFLLASMLVTTTSTIPSVCTIHTTGPDNVTSIEYLPRGTLCQLSDEDACGSCICNGLGECVAADPINNDPGGLSDAMVVVIVLITVIPVVIIIGVMSWIALKK
jgi:hypothetical protein